MEITKNEEKNKIMITAFTKAQIAFSGEAQHIDLENEQDIVDLVNEVRKEKKEIKPW